jgi:uncharacterized membrane protein YecN with MAPEG domain
MVCAIYAALLALIQVALTANVVRFRRSQRVSLGTEKGDNELLKAVRTHGNFTEIVPMGLLMILLAELQGVPLWCVHSLGALLLIGRLFHIYAILCCPNSYGLSRTVGMALSLATLILGALVNLWVAAFAL